MSGTLMKLIVGAVLLEPCVGRTGNVPVTTLAGADTWACRPRHPAVVNAVLDAMSGETISMRGEWDFVFTKGFAAGRRNSHDIPFFPDTDAWKKPGRIRVPGCWEAQLPREPGMGQSWEFKYDHNAKPIGNPALGEGWYRRFVDIPKAWSGKRIWLKVGGVKSCGWFWVNRKQVAHVYNYCGTYKYEITDCVTPGARAEILAQVSNLVPSRKGLMSAMHRWGGLYRDVELEATPQSFIDEAWIRGNFDAATAEAHVEIEGTGDARRGLRVRVTVENEVVESSTDKSRELTLTVPLRTFRPWSPEHPNLYTARVDLVSNGAIIQTRFERFGVRKIDVRGKSFYLNGRPLFLRGFGDDHVYPLTGITPADREVHRAHLAAARAAGFNFVRLHTHCEVPEYFEAADEAGILVEAELPYINGDIPVEHFAFDPVGDTLELYRHYRRHPSFAVYSGGNEGSFGPALDGELYKLVKALDPDRLKIGQDTQRESFNTPANSDFTGGPVAEWPHGLVNPDRPFVCHEYLNLCVKLDARSEGDYTGAWMPPVTRARRAAWLKGFGLDAAWGDRLQDAQHALQAYWLKHGVEWARRDPYCDGFCLWTIVDVVVAQFQSYTSQGLFDPFWRPKCGGWTADGFARFNSPCCILFDSDRPQAVYVAGDELSGAFALSDFGERADGHAACLAWRLESEGKTLAEGTLDGLARQAGVVRTVGKLRMKIPPVARPVKATLRAQFEEASNGWAFWLFPKREKIRLADVAATPALRPKLTKLYDGLRASDRLDGVRVLVAERGDPLVPKALAKGLAVVQLGPVNRARPRTCSAWSLGREVDPKVLGQTTFGTDDICLGWWFMGHQVGTALRDHGILKDFPHEGHLTPLLFRLIGQGRRLPQPGVDASTLVMAGEGGDACYSYLNVRGNLVEVDGLDLLSGAAEGTALLDGILSWVTRAGHL